MIAARMLAASLAGLVGMPASVGAAPSVRAPAELDGAPAPSDDEDPDPVGGDEALVGPAEPDPDAQGPDDALDDDGALADDGEPASAPARPRRYVWGGTDMEAGSTTEAGAARNGPVAAPDPEATAPGGYLGPTDTKEVAPKDGERKLLVAYIVLPLGTLAMVSGAVATWLTHPDHCKERLGRFGNDVNEKQCRGLWILNIVRTTYGSMMIASGAVLLGLGLRERKRHREWTRKHGAFVQPWLGRGQGGLVLGGRF